MIDRSGEDLKIAVWISFHYLFYRPKIVANKYHWVDFLGEPFS
jgi:hypothetical protein